MVSSAKDLSAVAERILGSSLLPVAMLSLVSGLLVIKFVTEKDTEESIQGFLIQVVAQMVPLSLLQMMVGRCPDPMGLLTKFAPKVLLVHILFLTPRIAYSLLNKDYWKVGVASTSLIAAIIALVRGFDFKLSFANLKAHQDLAWMVVLAIIAAFGTEGVEAVLRPPHYFKRQRWLVNYLWNVIFTMSNYIEIVSLVPAVLAVCISRTNSARESDGFDKAQMKQAALFFSFMTGFYVLEDLVQAAMIFGDEPFAAVAYVAHFALLLDFVGYFVVHVYNLGATKSELFMAAIGMV